MRRVVAEQLGIFENELPADARLITNLGADSLDHIELLMALEDEFMLEIPDEDAEEFSNASIQELIAAIAQRVKP